MAFRLPEQLPRTQHHHHYEHQQQQTQPQQQQQQHQQSLQPSSNSQPSPLAVPSSTLGHRHDDADSTEWIIFSPTQQYSPASGTARQGHTASTGRTPRLSDFDSLGSVHAAAEYEDDYDYDDNDDDDDDDEDLLAEGGDEEQNTELDSLDDGLRAFREPSGGYGAAQLHQSDPAMLPAHDGLGTFPASGMNVQQQLWQHERLNPHRRGDTPVHRRRPSSVQRHLDSIAAESQPRDSDYDRWQRIEQWRMDQSRAFLQEVEKETRHKRRTSRVSGASERTRALPRLSTSEVMGDVSVESVHNGRSLSREGKEDSLTGPGVAPVSGEDSAPQHAEESFWRRITRKVIKDLIGLDDSLLSVIMGESLMPIAEEEDGKAEASTELQTQVHHHAKKRKAATILEPELPEEMDEMLKTITTPHQGDDAWWQERLLQRIARELGTLVHQIREDPGAFSTYRRSSSLLQAQDQHSGTRTPRPEPAAPTPSSSHPKHSSNAPSRGGGQNMSIRSPNFTPTLQDVTTTTNNNKTTTRHTEAGGAAGKQYSADNRPQPVPPPATSEDAIFSEITTAERDKDYWERELDVGLVFQYLRKRLFTDTDPFTRNSSSQRCVNSPSQRAAIIRQHHPLVGRAHDVAISQRSFQFQAYASSTATATSPAGVGSTASPLLYRRMRRRSSSSCASQSTRKTLASGSSRNYWDIGGSVGSGSAVVAAVGGAGGGMGSWGDI